jgi:hypothetical protein
MGAFIVVRKNPTKNAPKQASLWGDLIFARVTLGEEEKAEFLVWMSQPDVPFEMLLQKYISEWYRFTLKYDANNRCAQCSVTCQDDNSVNGNSILISRGHDAFEALWLALYKMHVMCNDGEWPQELRESDWG